MWDVILVGGGLANGLIAWRLLQQQPKAQVLMLESKSQPGGNHTWSFHHNDITAEQHKWIFPLVVHRWESYDVQFPQFSRTLPGGYLTVTSDRFAQIISQVLAENLLTDSDVIRCSPTSVQLADGQTFFARAVIDGRGYRPSPYMKIGCQSFLGQQWQLKQPHGLLRPLLMDATVDQREGYRFVYTLPLTPDTLLIEDTHYIDHKTLNRREARLSIADYARAKGWKLLNLQREEQGDLPITLAGQPAAFWQQIKQQPSSGLRAGLFHPTTGYSLPLAVALADLITHQPAMNSQKLYELIWKFAATQWQRQRFFRLLNRMLFLAPLPAQRWQVMQHFYRLDDRLIARFYAGHPTLFDMARILIGKPPIPIGKALSAVLKHNPQLRVF